MTHRLILALALAALAGVPLAAENWPQWRGPRLNGVSAETNLPVRWSKTENIAPPVVSDGQIFVRTDSFLYAIGQRRP
jgi:hypothetical protein